MCGAFAAGGTRIQVELTEARFEIRHSVRRALAWHQLARIAFADSEIVGEFGEGLRTRVVYEAEGEAWASGCCIANVSIERDTGELAVERIVWVDDAGTVINPTLVEGQMIGGLMQGLGEATLERIVYDEDGQLVTASFMDYAMPRAVRSGASARQDRRQPVQSSGCQGSGRGRLRRGPGRNRERGG